MRIGIDASNIRLGGGVTHLKELLSAADSRHSGFSKVTVWGCRRTLDHLPTRAWLIKAKDPMLEGGILQRLLWQGFRLSRLAKESCDVLFVPGGNYFGNFEPVVAMSQNLLPFDRRERRRYGLSKTRLRLLLLNWGQIKTFRICQGVIFLTKSAQEVVERKTGKLRQAAVIPHGISERFRQRPRIQLPMNAFSTKKPFRWVYVSAVALYKHQWHVARAMAHLRRDGIPVVLDLVGPAFPEALKYLNEALREIDPEKEFIRYIGEVPYDDLSRHYHGADGFLFASSCENMPIILLEAMAAGLPITCSNVPPMPEVLADAGVYFHPENVNEIASALRKLFSDPDLRLSLAHKAYERAQSFTWERNADETVAFLASVGSRTGRGILVS